VSDARLRGTNLAAADLSGADLHAADLRGAKATIGVASATLGDA
jgi:uncharacterized protein YjbI with pentapeptide repeats